MAGKPDTADPLADLTPADLRREVVEQGRLASDLNRDVLRLREAIAHADDYVARGVGKHEVRTVLQNALEDTGRVTEPSREECLMALCAIRYTLGRRSYIVSDGVRWALHYGKLSAWVRGVVIRDIEELVERDARANGEFSFLGDEMDKREWLRVLRELKALSTAGSASP